MKASEIRTRLRGAAASWELQVVDEVTSTNDELKCRVMSSSPVVLFAENQSQGRGRRDNVWRASPGKNLMFSVGWCPEVVSPLWPRMTSLAALGVCEAIEAEVPVEAKIKWPNDILIDGRKVAGLLAETCCPGPRVQLVLGVGLNVNEIEFPEEIRGIATSLRLAVKGRVDRDLDRVSLAAEILNRLGERLAGLEDGYAEALSEIRQRSWLLRKQVRARVSGQDVYGRVVDLNGEGELVLELADGGRTTLVSVEGIREVVG